MKKTILLLLVLLTVTTVSAQVKYNSPLGNFKVTFGASPEYQNSDIDVDGGTVKLHMFIYTDPESSVFMVACADYPSDYLSSETSRQIFMDNAVTGFFEELNVEPGNRVEVKNGKFKGLEFRGLSTEYGVIYRVYTAQNTVFQVCIMTSGKYPDAKAAKSFFKSFKIIMGSK